MSEKELEIDDTDLYPKLSEKYYWEFDRNSDKGPYAWFYYVEVDDADYHIAADGFSIDFEDESSILGRFCPRDLFPGCENGLTDDQLMSLVSMPREGTRHTKDQVMEFYQEFIKWRMNQ